MTIFILILLRVIIIPSLFAYLLTSLVRVLFLGKSFWWWFSFKKTNQNGSNQNTSPSFNWKKVWSSWLKYVVYVLGTFIVLLLLWKFFPQSTGTKHSVGYTLHTHVWQPLVHTRGIWYFLLIVLLFFYFFLKHLRVIISICAVIIVIIIFWDQLMGHVDGTVDVNIIPVVEKVTKHAVDPYRVIDTILVSGGKISFPLKTNNDAIWIIPDKVVRFVYPTNNSSYECKVDNSQEMYDKKGTYDQNDVRQALYDGKQYVVENTTPLPQHVRIELSSTN